jgi:protein TonB
MISRRHLIAGCFAFGVTFGLFYLMQALISMADAELDESGRSQLVEFIRLRRDSQVETKKREIPEKKLPEKPPPLPDMNFSPSSSAAGDVGALAFGVGDLELETGPNMGAAASDSDVVPVVRVNPQYPIRAAERGIEGWVEVVFTITPSGTVKDPQVIASHPGRIFNREALRAIRKWKYNPKIEDGKPVERKGVKVRLRFELEHD